MATAPADPLSFEEFYAAHYGARYQALLAQEQSWQDEAFAAQPHSVCGFLLRGVTPYDLLLLHGCGNPFVVGGVIEPAHIAQFLAVLVEPAPRGWWSRRRFFKQCAALDYVTACAEIKAYVARMFASSALPVAPQANLAEPGATPVAPALNMCFLAPLVIGIAQETGWAEADILAMRLDKLFQYRRAIEARSTGRQGYPAADRLLSEALTAHAHYLATGELPAAT